MGAASDPDHERRATGATTSLRGKGPGDGDLDHAIAVLRARIDEDFKVRERLDAKQRQAFALAAGFFALAQTVALRFLDTDNVLRSEQLAIAIAAAIAAAAVAITAVKLSKGEKLEDQPDFDPAAVKRWCNEAASAPSEHYVSRKIVAHLVEIAEGRTAQNKTLAVSVDGVQTAAVFALIATGLELIVAVGTQLV